MLTVPQLAEQLGVSTALVYQLVAQGRLACYRIGLGRGAIRFAEADVFAYLESCRSDPEPRKAPAPSFVLKHLRP